MIYIRTSVQENHERKRSNHTHLVVQTTTDSLVHESTFIRSMIHVFIEASASSSLLTHCRAARLKPYKSCRYRASRSSWGLVLLVWCAEVSLILTSKETNMAHWLPSRNKAVHTNYPGMSVCVCMESRISAFHTRRPSTRVWVCCLSESITERSAWLVTI